MERKNLPLCLNEEKSMKTYFHYCLILYQDLDYIYTKVLEQEKELKHEDYVYNYSNYSNEQEENVVVKKDIFLYPKEYHCHRYHQYPKKIFQDIDCYHM